MKRNCDLELQLGTPSASNGQCRSMLDMVNADPKHQQMTIFYNGRVVVCDVTESQAREIILLASREMEENPTSSSGPDPNILLNLPIDDSPSGGFSMQRSLQRFLQKRKTRTQAATPNPN